MGLEGERKKGIDELGDLLVLCLLNSSSLLLHCLSGLCGLHGPQYLGF